MTLEETIEKNPATHYWLRDRIRDTRQLDPVDALYDAQTLVRVLRARLDGIEGR